MNPLLYGDNTYINTNHIFAHPILRFIGFLVVQILVTPCWCISYESFIYKTQPHLIRSRHNTDEDDVITCVTGVMHVEVFCLIIYVNFINSYVYANSEYENLQLTIMDSGF